MCSFSEITSGHGEPQNNANKDTTVRYDPPPSYESAANDKKGAGKTLIFPPHWE